MLRAAVTLAVAGVLIAGGQITAVPAVAPSGERTLLDARAAVGPERLRAGVRSLVLKGKMAAFPRGDTKPAYVAPIEYRILLPDNYLRIETSYSKVIYLGFRGAVIIDKQEAIREGAHIHAPSSPGGYLQWAHAHLAHLLLALLAETRGALVLTARARQSGAGFEIRGPEDFFAVLQTDPITHRITTITFQEDRSAGVMGGVQGGSSTRSGAVAPGRAAAPGNATVGSTPSAPDKRTVVLRLGDWQPTAGLTVPRRVTKIVDGYLSDEMRFTDVEFNRPLNDRDFLEVPHPAVKNP